MRTLYSIVWNHKCYLCTDVYELLAFMDFLKEPELKVSVRPTEDYFPKVEKHNYGTTKSKEFEAPLRWDGV